MGGVSVSLTPPFRARGRLDQPGFQSGRPYRARVFRTPNPDPDLRITRFRCLITRSPDSSSSTGRTLEFTSSPPPP